MNDPRIRTTVNPTGVTVKHYKPFNPSRKAVYKDGMWVHQFENLPMKWRNSLSGPTGRQASAKDCKP